MWYNYSKYNIYKFTINIFNIISLEIIFPAVRNNNLKTRSVWETCFSDKQSFSKYNRPQIKKHIASFKKHSL